MAAIPLRYTVLALSEMDSAEAVTELRYAAPALSTRGEPRGASSHLRAPPA